LNYSPLLLHIVLNYLCDKFIFKTVMDTDMKQLKNNLETHKFYLEMFDICSISYPTNINVIFILFPVHCNCDSLTLAIACEILS
jgi:hypothetical protein